jgi:hypothetical protein
MRYFRYLEQGQDDEPVRVTISDAQILREYFPHWKRQMEHVGKQALISEEACIEDFCAVNWAEEVAPVDAA